VGDGYVGSSCGSARDALLMSLTELTCTLSFSHSQSWRTVYFQQSLMYVHFCHFPNEMLMLCSSG